MSATGFASRDRTKELRAFSEALIGKCWSLQAWLQQQLPVHNQFCQDFICKIFVESQQNLIRIIAKYFPVFVILFFSLNLITFILYFLKSLLAFKFAVKIDSLFIFSSIKYHLFLFEFSNNFAWSYLNQFINHLYFYYIIGVN